MPKILIISAAGSDDDLPHVRAIASKALSQETQVVVRHIDGVPATAYIASEDIVLSPLLQAVRRGWEDGFDAIGIECASDPAVREAKALVPVPVTGPFESSCRIATSFGPFAVLYPGVDSGPNENLPSNANWIRRLAREYGCEHLLAGAAAVPVRRPDHELHEDSTVQPSAEQVRAVHEAVMRNMRAAIQTHGPALAKSLERDQEAEALIVACTFWGDALDAIRAAVRIPVIDPVRALARHVEWLARTATDAD